MKLTSPMTDPIGVDPRTSNAARPSADNSSGDSNSPPFDGVLADVGSSANAADTASSTSVSGRLTIGEASAATTTTPELATSDTTIVDALIGLLGKNAGAATAATAGATTSGEGSAALPPIVDAITGIFGKNAVAVPASTASSDAGANDTTIVDALIGFLGKNTSQTASLADTKGRTAGDKTGSDPSDSSSKGIGSPDDTTAPGQGAAPLVPTAIPTDVMSILLQSSNAKLLQAPAPDPGASATSKRDNADPKSLAVAASGDALLPSDSQETIVSGLSVATHLAPAPANATPSTASEKDQTKTSIQDTAAMAKSSFEPASTAAANGSTHARSDEPTTSAHGAEPSTTVSPTGPLGMSFAPLRSIATAIGELAANNAPSAAPTTADATKTPALAVARTMTLQLNPADLGTVDIRLHLTGQTLDVQLTVSDPQTLGMISRERDTLATALHDQSYQVNSLVIQDGGAAASSGGNNAANQGDTSSGHARPDRQNGGAGSDSQGTGRQGQGADGSPRGQRQPGSDTPSRPSADARGNSLFV